MEGLDAAAAASFETTAFLDHFKDLPDHRLRVPEQIAHDSEIYSPIIPI
jgi:hypothetical protein